MVSVAYSFPESPPKHSLRRTFLVSTAKPACSASAATAAPFYSSLFLVTVIVTPASFCCHGEDGSPRVASLVSSAEPRWGTNIKCGGVDSFPSRNTYSLASGFPVSTAMLVAPRAGCVQPAAGRPPRPLSSPLPSPTPSSLLRDRCLTPFDGAHISWPA